MSGNMDGILRPKVQDDSEFYKFALQAFDTEDLEMKTDIDFAMLYSSMHVFIEYAESHKFPTKLLTKLMYQYYKLRVSKNRKGRDDIVEISKNSIQQQQKTQ